MCRAPPKFAFAEIQIEYSQAQCGPEAPHGSLALALLLLLAGFCRNVGTASANVGTAGAGVISARVCEFLLLLQKIQNLSIQNLL